LLLKSFYELTNPDLLQTEIHEKRQHYFVTETESNRVRKVEQPNQNYHETTTMSGSSSNSDNLVEQEISIQTLPSKLNVRNREDFESARDEPSKLRELNFLKEQNKNLQEKLHQLHRQNER
jgi:hypothetical protein